MNQLQIFNNEQFGQVRALEHNGEPWFVGKDVCDIFGDANYRRSLARLDEEDKGVSQMTTPGGKQNMTIINESGLYALLFAMQPQKAKGVSQNDNLIESRVIKLKKFKRWVTSEVLPAIRKHGGYLTAEKIEEALLNPDTVIQLATKLKEEREKKEKLQAKLNEDKPYTHFAKAIANSSDSITVGEFAKIANNNNIRIGRNRLFDWLRDSGYLIISGREKNKPKQQYIEQGLFEVKEATIHTVDKDLIRTTTLITGKGQLYFLDKLKSNVKSA